MYNQNPNTQSIRIPFLPYTFRIYAGLVILCFVLSIIPYLPNHITSLMCCDFEHTVQKLQIWRLLTGWMCQQNFFVYTIAMTQFLWILYKFECKNGSSVALNDFLVTYMVFSFVIMVFQTIVYYGWRLLAPRIFTLSDQQKENLQKIPEWFINAGLTIIQINILYKYCYYNSEIQLKLPHPFKNRISLSYYPYIIYLLFVLSQVFNYLFFTDTQNGLTLIKFLHLIRIQCLIFLVLAIFECKYLNGGCILHAIQSYTQKQYYLSFIKAQQSPSWVPKNPKSLQQNHRSTISSSQFYTQLVKLKPGVKWNQIDKDRNKDPESQKILRYNNFNGEGIEIG